MATDPSAFLEAAIEFCWQRGMTIDDILDEVQWKQGEILDGSSQRSPHRMAESRLEIVRFAADLSDGLKCEVG